MGFTQGKGFLVGGMNFEGYFLGKCVKPRDRGQTEGKKGIYK